MKPGYKQTEVGVIPEEWDVLPITSVIQKGSRITYGVVKPGSRRDAGVLFIRGGDVFDGKILTDQLRTISKEISNQYKRTRLSGGELVISLVGYPGEVALVPHSLAGANIARQVALVRLDSTQPISGDYVCKFLQSNQGRRLLLKESIGSAQQVINLRDITRVVLVLPSEAEQRAIATALNDVDGLLGGLDRLIAKKRDLKQAAMQQLLTGQTRLPGFHGEWEVKKLGNIATCFSGGTPPTEVASYYGGDIPWITSGDLNRGYINEVEGRISHAGLANSAAQMVEANTLLIALYGATSGVTAISKLRAAINQAVLAIVPRHDDTSFLYFKLSLLKDWLISTYTQGGQPNLSGDIVKSVELPLPPHPEQTAIASVLTEMDAELAGLEQRREKTRALKQAMMQELLTGRTRLL